MTEAVPVAVRYQYDSDTGNICNIRLLKSLEIRRVFEQRDLMVYVGSFDENSLFVLSLMKPSTYNCCKSNV